VPVVVSEAIVLHAFDYLESSRILRLLTREAGLRSALARGARRSRKRFGGGLDLFAHGTATLHGKPGRDLDTLSAFDDIRSRAPLARSLDRFTGAGAIAEIAIRFGSAGGDARLFDAVAAAFDAIIAASEPGSRVAALGGAWRIVAALGHAPALSHCADCGDALDEAATLLFAHPAGGALCPRCSSLSPGGRRLPGAARAAIAAWLDGGEGPVATDAERRAHQRLLREFLEYHLHDGRALRAFDLWEGTGSSAA